MSLQQTTGAQGPRWSGRIGFILAAMGSAVGLGSIWKFPYEVGENGGGGFLLFYVLGLLLVVVPLMLAEFAIGRAGRGDAAASVFRLAEAAGRSRRWGLVGLLGVVTGFIVLTYYAVIAAITMAYIPIALGGGLSEASKESAAAVFAAVTGNPWTLAAWQAAFLALCALIAARGIEHGLEVACKILMPLLLALMLLLVGYALREGDVGATLRFLFTLSAEGLTPRAALEALGLGFFSIGVGMGLMITYAAYAGAQFNLRRISLITVLGDTLISILAGLAIFPIVFARGLDPAEGPALMFVTLPLAFAELPFASLVAAAFFLLLFVAALASAMSMVELATAPLLRWTGFGRGRLAFGVAGAAWIAGLPTLLSFSSWAGLRPLAGVPGFAEANLYDVIDGLASNLLLPLSGILLAVFAGWFLSRRILSTELGEAWSGSLRFLLRYLVPFLILSFVIGGLFVN